MFVNLSLNFLSINSEVKCKNAHFKIVLTVVSNDSLCSRKQQYVSKQCKSYHAVLLIEHQSSIFVTLKQRFLESKILGDSVEDNRLQLLVIANEHHLICILE